MIKNLILKNFRKFKNKKLEFNKNITVLYGNNAQGKSSVLEALSLISNGKSPWTSTDEYINTQQNEQIYTRIEMERDNKIYVYFKENDKKIFKIDGKNVKSKTFFTNSSATIFNPEKIELLMISPSQRRNFLDETIMKYNYEYESSLKDFRKVLRQRNAYLKKLAKLFYEQGILAVNDTQLIFWTNKFIQLSIPILQNRIQLTQDLSKMGYEIKYTTNYIIDKRSLKSNDYIQNQLMESIEENKRRDIATGYTNIGPHRDDWEIHNGMDIKKFGSRGEKRLAIGQLIFQTQKVVKEKTGFYPILLLDDIASELDIENTKKIFNKEILSRQQTFITTIDYKTLPKEIIKESDIIHLNGMN